MFVIIYSSLCLGRNEEIRSKDKRRYFGLEESEISGGGEGYFGKEFWEKMGFELF